MVNQIHNVNVCIACADYRRCIYDRLCCTISHAVCDYRLPCYDGYCFGDKILTGEENKE